MTFFFSRQQILPRFRLASRPPQKTVHVEEQNSLNLPHKVLKATQPGCTLHDVPYDDMCMPGEWGVGIAVDREVLYLVSPMMTCACQVSGLWG